MPFWGRWCGVQALLNSSHLFHEAQHGMANYGVTVENVKMDISKMMAQKDKAVKGLTAGVEGLFKKNKVCPLKRPLLDFWTRCPTSMAKDFAPFVAVSFATTVRAPHLTVSGRVASSSNLLSSTACLLNLDILEQPSRPLGCSLRDGKSGTAILCMVWRGDRRRWS